MTIAEFRAEIGAAKTEVERTHIRMRAELFYLERDMCRFEERHPELRRLRRRS